MPLNLQTLKDMQPRKIAMLAAILFLALIVALFI